MLPAGNEPHWSVSWWQNSQSWVKVLAAVELIGMKLDNKHVIDGIEMNGQRYSFKRYSSKKKNLIKGKRKPITNLALLTCGDVNVCDIHNGPQSQGEAVIVKKAPEVVHCPNICHIQLHLHFVLVPS